jgi:hypothetical protein
MSKLKMVLAAATVCGALGMGNASAMPMDNLALDNQSNIESVRYVCDVYGHCFWRPNYYAPYYYGGYRRGYRGGYRGGFRGRGRR